MSESPKNTINRREAIRRTALLLGGVVSAPIATGFLNGCTAKADTATSFSAEQIKFLDRISDVIIPATDTAGAADVGVVNYINDMVFVFFEEEDRQQFFSDMEAFMEKAASEIGKPFNEATEQEQQDFVYAEHEAVFGGDVNWDAPRPFIWTMKEMTITGYFSSETGMTEVLQYQLVPGRYESCITFEEAGGRVHAV